MGWQDRRNVVRISQFRSIMPPTRYYRGLGDISDSSWILMPRLVGVKFAASTDAGSFYTYHRRILKVDGSHLEVGRMLTTAV